MRKAGPPRAESLVRFALLVVCLVASIEPSFGDTVVLRNGRRHDDVKTKPRGRSQVLQFSDGRIITVPNREIRSLFRARTSWTRVRRPTRRVKKAETIVKPEVKEPEPVSIGMAIRVLRDEPAGLARHPVMELAPWVRSAIAPGWGQWHTDRRAAAVTLASLGVFLFARYWEARKAHTAAEDAYNDRGPTNLIFGAPGYDPALKIGLVYVYLRERERTVLTLETAGNNALLFLAVGYFYNIFDAYFGGAPWQTPWHVPSKGFDIWQPRVRAWSTGRSHGVSIAFPF